MTFLLDSNVCIRYLNGRSLSVKQRLESYNPSEIVVCSVVKAEMFSGALRSAKPAQNLVRQQTFFNRFISLPFDDAAAKNYANVHASLAVLGTLISTNDLMIAAIVLTHNLTLVMHNTREFSRVRGLQLEDWEIAPFQGS
jgi:tRNA(fMet)-specific endonuclease VapC